MLIYKVVWDFHKSTGVDWDDLLSEAMYGYCQAIEYCREKKKPNYKNAILRYANWNIRTYLEKERRAKCVSIDEHDHIDKPVDQTPFFELFESLTEECKEIVGMIMENPHSYLEVSPKKARGLVVNDLRQKGWTWPCIWRNLKNMKVALNE